MRRPPSVQANRAPEMKQANNQPAAGPCHNETHNLMKVLLLASMFLGPHIPTDVVCFSRRRSNPTGQTFTLFNKRAFPPATHLRPSALSSIFAVTDLLFLLCSISFFFYLALKEKMGENGRHTNVFRNQSNGGEEGLMKQPNSLLTISTCASGSN